MAESIISFTVYGTPRPGGSKTMGHTADGRVFLRDSSGNAGAAWKREVVKMARLTMRNRPPLDGPLELHVEFWLPRPQSHFGKAGLKRTAPVRPIVKPDATKLLRLLEDACTGEIWKDDAQIVRQTVEKLYGDPRAAVYVWPYADE